MAIKFFVVFLIAFFGCAVAEIIELKPCSDVPADQCTISEVRIDPCKEVPKACRFKKGKDAAISFDFVPNFTATKLKTMVYWANGALEPEFGDLDSDACKHTTCPAESGRSQQLNFQLHVGKKLPSGTFPIKWKVWNEEDENQVCCFQTTISLRR